METTKNCLHFLFCIYKINKDKPLKIIKMSENEEKLAKFVNESEQPVKESPKISAPTIGFSVVSMNELPSKGMFYPRGTEIHIRAAEVREIKHWSTMDVNDFRSVDESIDFVIQNCVTVKFPQKIASWKDIKEIDRLYLIFAVRELTFKDGENKLFLPGSEQVEIRKEMLKYFELDEKLKRVYSEDERCFIITNKKNPSEFVKMYIPSIGVSGFIKKHVDEKRQSGAKLDEDFIKYAAFLFDEYRTLDEKKFQDTIVDSNGWTLFKISAYSQVSDIIVQNVNPQVVYEKGGEEVTAPLNFQGGLKSIFLISDIFI